MLIFTERTTPPAGNDKNWIKTNFGGYNRCILGNPSYGTGSVLSNCTGYAWGRWLEILEVTDHNLYTGNGGSWYGHTSDGYQRGSTPELGAVACWSGGDGHVAIVEKVYSDGSIDTTDSVYGGAAFRRVHYTNSYSLLGYTFQGFIYLPDVITGSDVALLKKDRKKVKVVMK